MRKGPAAASAVVLPLAVPFFCTVFFFAVGFYGLGFCAVGARAQVQNPAAVRSVEIKSTLSSLGGRRKILRDSDPPKITDDKQETDLVFENKSGLYYLKGGSQGEDKVVDASLIADLAKAVTEPANPEPNAKDLGITPDWLKTNAPLVAQRFSHTWIGGRPIHPDLFESAFADPAMIDNAIRTLFSQQPSCMDCVHYFRRISVAVTFDDGTMVRVHSHSALPYMLPWEVGHLAGPGAGTNAYNAAISRAILALLPEESENRALLAGENFANALGNIVLRDEENESHWRDVESQTGGTLSAIRAKYTIDSANIGDRKYYGLAGAGGGESDLVLRLTAPHRPSSFRDDVALAYVDGKVVGTEKFLSDAPRFEKLVFSVPWLNQYTQNHPKVPISLAFVHGASLSDEELNDFSEDMRGIGQEKIISKVEAARDNLALLTIGESNTERSEWLVFPDRHMLLWRFSTIPGLPNTSGLPAWDSSQYSAKPCVASKNHFARCVGREVSPEGALQPAELDAAVKAQ